MSHLGPRPALNQARQDLVDEQRLTTKEIAEVVGCSRATLYRALDSQRAS